MRQMESKQMLQSCCLCVGLPSVTNFWSMLSSPVNRTTAPLIHGLFKAGEQI